MVDAIREKLIGAILADDRSTTRICADAGTHWSCVMTFINGGHRSLSLEKMCLLARAVGLRIQIVAAEETES